MLDLEALPATEREARVTGAQRVLEAVVSRADRAFVPRLFELFDDPKMRWLVPYLCNVLARIGGPEVEARGQEIQAAMLGMGRALNQDVARRAELLGIAVDARSSGGIQKYRDLDVARFERLLEEGFIHPQAAQNAAPSPAELFALMREHPEILAQGYAVLPSRADYRAMVDGISCELRGLPGERAEAIRQVFTSLSERASNAELDGDSIALWWT